MKRAEEGKEKKFLSVERCFWPVGTDFTLNLICFSQKSTDNLEITILCLQSYLLFLLSRLKCRYISFTLYFAHQNSSFIQIVNTQRIKTHFNLRKILEGSQLKSQESLSKVFAKSLQSLNKISAKSQQVKSLSKASRNLSDSQQCFSSRLESISFSVNLYLSFCIV